MRISAISKKSVDKTNIYIRKVNNKRRIEIK